jgi:hypothetical protein
MPGKRWPQMPSIRVGMVRVSGHFLPSLMRAAWRWRLHLAARPDVRSGRGCDPNQRVADQDAAAWLMRVSFVTIRKGLREQRKS